MAAPRRQQLRVGRPLPNGRESTTPRRAWRGGAGGAQGERGAAACEKTAAGGVRACCMCVHHGVSCVRRERG